MAAEVEVSPNSPEYPRRLPIEVGYRLHPWLGGWGVVLYK